ncbi:MAG: divalent metal cation transporter [Acidobacteria bacterium]|nr:divalent metal cation transporter [Acidobacteriota bacterium]
MALRARLLSILFWSVIAAAFIGPGTVTTAASAGASHGAGLLWALVFSTVACLILQEASCRITVVSGSNLGQALVRQYSGRGAAHVIPLFAMVAILLGCAAFEAGNILGAVAGLELISGVPRRPLTLLVGTAAMLILSMGSTRLVASLLGGIVAVLGISFLTAAIALRPEPTALLAGSLVPSMPEGAGLLVLALIGTTVVPYNLFLGSGLSHSQTLGEMRFGLGVAIIIGGIISMAILVVGSATAGAFSYQALAEALAVRLGAGAPLLLGIGLFAAGLSSAVTAPLAAAITARSVLGGTSGAGPWSIGSWRYRLAWASVLGVGLAFGLAEVQPIPAIILAQAANGVVLPLVAVFLFIAVNDRQLMGPTGLNRTVNNSLMAIVVFVTIVLGVTSVMRAVAGGAGIPLPAERTLLTIAAGIALALAVPVAQAIRRGRRPPATGAPQMPS